MNRRLFNPPASGLFILCLIVIESRFLLPSPQRREEDRSEESDKRLCEQGGTEMAAQRSDIN